MRIFSAMFLFVFSISVNSMSFSEAQAIYNKIAIINNIPAPILVLRDNVEVNADETDTRIAVNSGMLLFVKNQSEIALVLGHELGHFTLHHEYSSIAHEYAADYKGAIYMSNAGFKRCLGAQMFKRMYQGPSDDHPMAKDRITHLGCS